MSPIYWFLKVQSAETKTPIRSNQKIDHVRVFQFVHSHFSTDYVGQYFQADSSQFQPVYHLFSQVELKEKSELDWFQFQVPLSSFPQILSEMSQ